MTSLLRVDMPKQHSSSEMKLARWLVAELVSLALSWMLYPLIIWGQSALCFIMSFACLQLLIHLKTTTCSEINLAFYLSIQFGWRFVDFIRIFYKYSADNICN